MAARTIGPRLSQDTLDRALESLAVRLEENGAEPAEIVICGGSALILADVVSRATRDVDIVALVVAGSLHSPDPLPGPLQKAAIEAAEDMGLPESWLNNGPSRGEGGLFQMGLPAGLVNRLHARTYGSHLTVHLIDRVDQIHFKLFAAADRGGYHVEDLLALDPTADELEAAARWAMSLDVPEGFAGILRDLLKGLGHEEVADRL